MQLSLYALNFYNKIMKKQIQIQTEIHYTNSYINVYLKFIETVSIYCYLLCSKTVF